MSINAVSQANTAQVASTASHTQSANQGSTPAKAQSAAKDTVTISSAAVLAAQEAMETPAQTAKEARGGDMQAKRLLAKQAASEEAGEPASIKAQEAPGAV